MAQLDEDELGRRRVKLSRGFCVECEPFCPEGSERYECPTLVNSLCTALPLLPLHALYWPAPQ